MIIIIVIIAVIILLIQRLLLTTLPADSFTTPPSSATPDATSTPVGRVILSRRDSTIREAGEGRARQSVESATLACRVFIG